MILTAVVMSVAASLCSADELSVDARALQQQLAFRMPMAVRSWVMTEVQRVRSDPQWEERRVRVDAQAQFAGQPVIGPDLDALVFLVYVEVVQQLDREIRRGQIRVEPARKRAEKMPSAPSNTVAVVTNAVAEAIAQEQQALTERRAKLAEHTDELGRQLSPLSGTLLENIR